MEYKDYYKILGVEKTATQDEIKKAYRKIAKEHHPDVKKDNKVSEDKFKGANEAYEVIGDKDKRQKYDTMGSAGFQNGNNFDPSQYGFGGANTSYEFKNDGGADGFSDFFNMFFGGRGRGGGSDANDMFGGFGSQGSRRRMAVKGSDAEAEIEIFPEEGLNGVERRVTFSINGNPKTISFKIPKGIRDNEKIKLKGQGSPGSGGAPNGDLFLIVKIKNNEKYIIKGNNIETKLNVSPWEAALGTTVEIPTLDGNRITVKIPSGIQTGNKIKVRNKGYIDKKENRGDLYLKIRIINPQKLSSKEKELYKKLKDESDFLPER